MNRRRLRSTTDDPRPKFYALEMLPYPSGFLHMGHVRNYSIGDALAWYKRLQGFNVLHPIGWDSFGQPAEQAAIKRGVNPRDWTEENIAHMRGQMQRLGISYDWSREIAAHRPDYYKWDQWFFLKMFERGLAYKKQSPVNWCPKEGTVLSNEQSSGGVCWRCGAAVEKRDLEQWFLRITDYAEQLVEHIKQIESTLAGKSFEASTRLGRSQRRRLRRLCGERRRAKDSCVHHSHRHDSMARPQLCCRRASVVRRTVGRISTEERRDAFAEQARAQQCGRANTMEEEEKEGINTGVLAINPFNGETMPVWVGNYVLMEYGTGAVMSVPAHDERDYEFAQKYSLPIRRVIERISHRAGSRYRMTLCRKISRMAMPHAFTDYGILVNSGDWSGKLSKTRW